MRRKVKSYLDKLNENKKGNGKRRIWVALCSILVALGVLGVLIAPGEASETGTDGTSTVNESLVIGFSPKEHSASSGTSISIKVISNYSKANYENEKVTSVIKLGELPEGISLAGFDGNGQQVVKLQGAEGIAEQEIILQIVEQDGISYIEYAQPAGSTLEFDIQFKSKNGITADNTSITVEVAEDMVEGLGEDAQVTIAEGFSESATLTWNAKNEWDPVDKKVNDEDANAIAVTADNKLSGMLTYTIKATSLNRENFGRVWTKEIQVIDSLTLPSNISFPSDIKVDGNAIVTEAGETVLSFEDLPEGTTVNILNISDDKKTISYSLTVPNTHVSNGVLTAEQDNLDLTMKLNAELLVLPADYNITHEIGTIDADKIINSVSVQPIPYHGDAKDPTLDAVVTVPEIEAEKWQLTKSADQEEIEAGGVITYTLKLENISQTPIEVEKEDGSYYTVTDVLPAQLYLTTEQQNALPENVTYDSDTNTITWTPSKEAIPYGQSYEIQFATTVKAITDEDIKDLSTGYEIKNTAEFKDAASNETTVEYCKAVLTVSKTATTADGNKTVYNGEKVTYTVVISNKSGVDAQNSETMTDMLPTGVTLENVYVYTTQNGTTSSQEINVNGGECVLHDVPADTSNTNCVKADHKVVYARDAQNLSFDIGALANGESVKIQYVCTVDTDQISTRQNIYNTAKTTEKSSQCVIGVDYPITLEKTVDKNDGAAYPSGEIFEYTITVSNDADHPSLKDDLKLVDQLPSGMLPYPNGEDSVLIMTTASGTQEISWSDYVDEVYDSEGGTFSTSVSGRTATVEKVNGAVKLTWDIGSVPTDAPIVLTYKAQMILTAEQQETGTAYNFVNTATIDNISKSVTVIGGQKTGKLMLKKRFAEVYSDETIVTTLGDLDTDPNWDIEFLLTQLDDDGNAISERTIKMTDFTGPVDDIYTYEIDNLPIGKYRIEEFNFVAKEGCEALPQFSYFLKMDGIWYQTMNFHKLTFDLAENQEIDMSVTNYSFEYETVKFQKSVYEIGKLKTGDTTWTSLPEKYLFSIDDTDTDKTYVVYNLTTSVTGGYSVELGTIVDQLPKGLKFVGLCSTSSYAKKSSAFSQTITTSSSNGFNDAVSVENNLISYLDGYTVTADSYDEDTNEVTISIKRIIKGSSYTYIHSNVSAGEAISFGMLCEVDSDVMEGQELTNTATLTVTGAEYVDTTDVYSMTNTPYDQKQNNGDVKWEDVVTDDSSYKTITSSVTVVPQNSIVPGIEKNAVSYIPAGSTQAEIDAAQEGGQGDYSIGEYTNIQSNSAVKWEITLHNDGTQDMTNYSIQDVVSEDQSMMTSDGTSSSKIHLLTEADNESYQITTPYMYQIYNYKGELQSEEDISDIVWAQVADGTNVKEFTFDFSDSKYTIPSGGYAVLTLYTSNPDQENKIYNNTATVLPTQEFVAGKVTLGELVKDSNGSYIGVKASDQVYSLGKYASVSWKTITEKADSTNTAKGASSKNYIVVEKESEYVTYTNNIRNISDNNFNKFVVIDLLPMKNDTGVINRNDLRGSEFQVLFAEELSVKVLDNETGEYRDVDYDLEFSAKTAFTQNDFAGVASDSWHTDYNEAEDLSFRVVLADTFMLAPQETLIIQYDGKIESSATPGTIAWNSFGYQYYLTSDQAQYMRAEPPKVGVMIPAVPMIQKEVIDSEGNVQEKDANINFTFALFEKTTSDTGAVSEQYLCEFTLSQGGYRQLDDLIDTNGNPIELVEGTEYVIRELTDEQYMPKYYEAVGIGENGGTLSDSFSFVYCKTEKINILARNKVTNYVPELPATGANSALIIKVIGSLLLILSAVLLCGYKVSNQKAKRRG